MKEIRPIGVRYRLLGDLVHRICLSILALSLALWGTSLSSSAWAQAEFPETQILKTLQDASNASETEPVMPPDRLEEISLLFDKYYEGQGVQRDYAKAFELAKEAAEMGDALGMYRLALLYDQGKGVGRDREEAGRWFLICIETQGDPILEALDPETFSREFWRVVQRKMREAGLYRGRIDGAFGNATMRGLVKLMELSGG